VIGNTFGFSMDVVQRYLATKEVTKKWWMIVTLDEKVSTGYVEGTDLETGQDFMAQIIIVESAKEKSLKAGKQKDWVNGQPQPPHSLCNSPQFNSRICVSVFVCSLAAPPIERGIWALDRSMLPTASEGFWITWPMTLAWPVPGNLCFAPLHIALFNGS